MSAIFGRRISLIAYGAKSVAGPLAAGSVTTPDASSSTPQDGIDLSDMHITFNVYAPDTQTPKTAIIRVFNLSDGNPTHRGGPPTKNTARQIQNEFSRVILQAGYQDGPFAAIFDGTIKQVRRGRMNATDTFVEMYAADGDLGINFAMSNTTLAPGSTPQQRAERLASDVAAYGLQFDASTLPATGGILPRGKVLFGMFKDQMRQLASDQGFSWHVDRGVVRIVPEKSYIGGDPIVLTHQTGLVGVPELTQDGLRATSLLNPNIVVGGRVQIDNKSLNQTVVREQGFPTYSSVNFFASEQADGVYRVLVVEHAGDTRGDDWHTNLTCLSIDASAPAASSVKAAG